MVVAVNVAEDEKLLICLSSSWLNGIPGLTLGCEEMTSSCAIKITDLERCFDRRLDHFVYFSTHNFPNKTTSKEPQPF